MKIKIGIKTKISVIFLAVSFLVFVLLAFLLNKLGISVDFFFSGTSGEDKFSSSAESVLFLTLFSLVITAFVYNILKTVSDLEKKANEADRAKSEFVSMASHQLRTPLANVNWYTEMLLAGDAGKLNKTQKLYLEEVYNSNQRMVELVNALLNVDLGTFAVEPEPTDLREIAESTLSDLQYHIKNKNIKIEQNYDRDLPTVNADPRLLRIIFQNLLSNSIKYNKQGGRVAITIKKREEDILISVSDNGLGIPKKQQSKIFTRLFRADNVIQKGEGTGFGLYIVKAVVDQTGGQVWFESEENEGSTFFFTVLLKGMQKKKGTKFKGNNPQPR